MISTNPTSKMPVFLPIALVLGLSGCRRATEQDCERIVDRIVELELKDQKITDPKLVEERKAATRASKRGELVSGCVGKRITDTALACIDKAETAAEVTEKCLR